MTFDAAAETIYRHRLISEPPETLADRIDAIIEATTDALTIATDASPSAARHLAQVLAEACTARMCLAAPGDDHATAERLGAEVLGLSNGGT